LKAIAITSLSAAALALASCGPKATTSADAGSNDTAVAASNDTATAPSAIGGQAFANAAAASDAFEIATSRLALTSASSPAIKRYAQKMIDAHTDSTAQLKTAATSASPAITPDPSLTADQQAKLDALKPLSGKAFDQAYAAAQTEGHQKTLDTLRSYASSGDVPSLKAFATTITPIVAAHLNMAKALKA
jgi:putative membrane protein